MCFRQKSHVPASSARPIVRYTPPGWCATAASGLLALLLLNLVSVYGDPLAPAFGASVYWPWLLLVGGPSALVLAVEYSLHLLPDHRDRPRRRLALVRWSAFPILGLAVLFIPAADELRYVRFTLSRRALERVARDALVDPSRATRGWVGLYYCYSVRAYPDVGTVQFETAAYIEDDGSLEPTGLTFVQAGAPPRPTTLTFNWYGGHLANPNELRFRRPLPNPATSTGP